MNYITGYTKFLGKFLKLQAPLKMVLDTSNGTAVLILKELFKDAKGLEIIFINKVLSGDFPGHGPNPLIEGATDEISKMVIQQGADLGAIYDGDGDRVVFIDDEGKVVDTFDILRLLKDEFSPPYVVDVGALAKFTLSDLGVIETATGRTNIHRVLKKKRAELGVERSGHFFFKKFFYQDSAVLATIYVMNAVSALKKNKQKTHEALADLITFERPAEINFEIDDGEGALRKLEEYYRKDKVYRIEKTDGVTVVGPDFAFNLRISNTEPLVRLNIAAKNRKVLDEKLTEIKKTIEIQ